MRKPGFEISGVRFFRIVCVLYLLLFGFESLKSGSTVEIFDGVYLLRRKTFSQSEDKDYYLQQKQNEIKKAPLRPYKDDFSLMEAPVQMNQSRNLTDIERSAMEAWGLGLKAWKDVKVYAEDGFRTEDRQNESCPQLITMSSRKFSEAGKMMLLPCGLRLGSSITLVGRPRDAHLENDSTISRLKEGDPPVLISQFALELQGLKAVVGEAPTRILHFNPRLKGDWTGRPVVEQNTCYRMQWGSEQRCEGSQDDETGI